MENSRTETLTGILESIVPLKQSKKGSWYFGVYIRGEKYNKFGSREELKKIVSKLTTGSNVRISFRKKYKEGTVFRELITISGVFGGQALPHNNHIIPVSQTWTFIENGEINIKKLKMALKCIAVDCNFLHDELDKVKK